LFYSIFSYETSDGVSRQEQAEVKNLGTDNEALSVVGSVSWTAGKNNKMIFYCEGVTF
jgi:Insect cuticle protein